ncbi:hypothetical protein [Variovorax beijingensis]|uniref:hypothetical protein n=1 Tax=Variovorax beijingensis TaxID=2496117 RepID=UPI0016397EFA|nr:hypothetical protein [Variovorax beijingensis]
MDLPQIACVFRRILTADFGIVTDLQFRLIVTERFGVVTAHFGDRDRRDGAPQ